MKTSLNVNGAFSSDANSASDPILPEACYEAVVRAKWTPL
jgi:hypothetical protein